MKCAIYLLKITARGHVITFKEFVNENSNQQPVHTNQECSLWESYPRVSSPSLSDY